MAEEEKNEGAVPPRLDLRKSGLVKPASDQAAPVPPVKPAVSAPSPAQPMQPQNQQAPVQPAVAKPAPPLAPAPVAPAPTVTPQPLKPAPEAVKPAQPSAPVAPKPVSAPQGPQQINQTPSDLKPAAAAPAQVKPTTPPSGSGPITLKAGSPMKPLQPLKPAQANINISQAPAAPAEPAPTPQPVTPAAVPESGPTQDAPSLTDKPETPASPAVMGPKPAEPVKAAAPVGPAPVVKPAGIGPLKPSPAPAAPLTPAAAKPTLKIGVAPSAQAKTIRLKPGPGAAPKAVTPIAAPTSTEGHDPKKDTSRIPLDAAQVPAGGGIKTGTGPVELKPNEEDSKRKTSRISLESVLAAEDSEGAAASGPSSGPKTIKLKRPSEAVTIKAVKKGPVVARPAAPVAADLSKTAPLDDVADGATASGKRTVKVKRPSMKIKAGGGAAATGDGVAPSAGGVSSAQAKAAQEAVYEDTAHWVFWLFSLAAVLVVSVMTYMFTSQVIGPDYSLTKASYYTEGYNLDWPYKLSKMP